MKPPEEDAPFQAHVDWIYYAYWEKPIILPIMYHLGQFLLWFTNWLMTFIGTITEEED